MYVQLFRQDVICLLPEYIFSFKYKICQYYTENVNIPHIIRILLYNLSQMIKYNLCYFYYQFREEAVLIFFGA